MDDISGNELIDLEKRIEDAPTVTDRACAMADMAWKIKYSNPKRAVNLADKAIQLTQTDSPEAHLPVSYMSKAVSLSQMSRFDAAEDAVKSGLALYRKQDNQAGVLHALNGCRILDNRGCS